MLKKADAETGTSVLRNRYKQFRVSLLVAIACVGLLPTTVISVLGYVQYLSRSEKKDLQQLEWHLGDSQVKLEHLINKTQREKNTLPAVESLQQLAQRNNLQTEVFIIDNQGVLLTSSFPAGSERIDFLHDISEREENVFSEKKPWGKGFTYYAFTPLANSSWLLVLAKEGPLSKGEWRSFQVNLFFMYLVCFVVSLFVILELVSLLTSRIRESDIKRMALLSEAEHANKLASIGRLATGVAHEINNPLAIIDQKAGLIEDLIKFSEDFSHQDSVNRSVQGIHEGVQRCKVITHRLLSFARKMDTRIEPIDINALLVEVVGFLEKEALSHRISLDFELAEDLPQVESDKGQLEQVFLNIINNAIAAIGFDGVIRLESRKSDAKHVRITVEDNGPGMSSEVLSHIFDPFFTTKDPGKGTGLGLSITYGLIKRLGGEIEVESKLDVGTHFFITLPVHHKVIKGDSHA